MHWNVGAQRCCALMVGMTVDGAPEHHPDVGFRRVGAGLEPARTIVSIVAMWDGGGVVARHAVPVWRYVGFRHVGAGSEPAPTIVSIVAMWDGDAVLGHGAPCPYVW
jgi:hypothetical protein